MRHCYETLKRFILSIKTGETNYIILPSLHTKKLASIATFFTANFVHVNVFILKEIFEFLMI
ncbi:hypothetical protein DD595_24955 [Enterobacter cloacae complex sp. 4DZ3-17B2]|nr:hypothetical protein DD595_24955 [Enterobacter cloacae complex sp. 4DZ3-17B2]